MKLIDSQYLSNLVYKIQTLPPEEASLVLLEASTIILFAGFPEIAYQGFLKLTQGELKISEGSVFASSIKEIIPALCYLMKIPCPPILSQEEMSFSELEKYINKNLEEDERLGRGIRCFYFWFYLVVPSNKSEEFLDDIATPKVDIKRESRFNVNSFFQGLRELISQCFFNQGKWQGVSRCLEVFFENLFAWKLGNVSYVEPEIMFYRIPTYLRLGDTNSADKLIQRWWKSLERIIDGLSSVMSLPYLMKMLSEGVLRNKINISEEQVQEFLDLINRRNYIPRKIGFIPTIDDWKSLLEKWNEAIFNSLDEKDIEHYEFEYSDIFNRKSCLEIGATEEEISELEKRLGIKLPLSYRNFLLTSNGFTILREDCELYGTKKIKWFIEDEDNRYWAECYGNDDDVTDERYFQYGEHQNCCVLRSRYMKASLQISSTEDGYIYLLNPQVIDSRNEWEAWDFSNNYPGAYRYRSFWEMMQEVYKKSLSS